MRKSNDTASRRASASSSGTKRSSAKSRLAASFERLSCARPPSRRETSSSRRYSGNGAGTTSRIRRQSSCASFGSHGKRSETSSGPGRSSSFGSFAVLVRRLSDLSTGRGEGSGRRRGRSRNIADRNADARDGAAAGWRSLTTTVSREESSVQEEEGTAHGQSADPNEAARTEQQIGRPSEQSDLPSQRRVSFVEFDSTGKRLSLGRDSLPSTKSEIEEVDYTIEHEWHHDSEEESLSSTPEEADCIDHVAEALR